MNHSCYLSNIQTVREELGEDVWSELRESTIGVIVKLKELHYIWYAKVVHHFLANQLATESSHEIWSLIDDFMPLCFSLYEFGDNTGLNCDPFDKHDVRDVDHQEFWLEMNVPTSDGPILLELQAIFPICRNWPREKRVMIGLLCLLSIGIFGISSNIRIPLHCAKRVMDTAAFQRYLWCRVGFRSLVESIKVLTYEAKKSYTLHGCVHALLIWIYEFVPGLGKIYGNRIEGADVPLLSWGRNLVRVRHMIMKPVEDIYRKWDNDKIYTDLDNMIKDILNGQLNEKFLDAMPTTKCEKRKYGVAASVSAHNIAINGLAELLKILTARVEGINVSVADKVTKALDATIDCKVEARLRVYDSDLRKQIAKLEAQINDSKNNASVNIAPDVTTSKAYEDEDDGTCSNDLKKINSQDGLPVDCVVKKEKKDKKMMDSTQNLTNKEVIKTEKKAGIALRRLKQEKAFAIPQLNDESISSKDLENHLQWEKSHIAAAMLMFHRLSRQEQSLYSSSRIAFLSHWFVNSWVNDYKNWDQNMTELSEMYIKAYNGEHPTYFVTSNKWNADVHDLFLCHHVNGDHWVPLRIDLQKAKIHVYDSICIHVSDKEMKEACRPFMRMISALLNKMMPAKTTKKSEKQFAYIRHKKIPQNEDPGDCGVYSLMYIESLALGRNFDGLNDQIITPLRSKLAAYIYEEVTKTIE
ncbi:uncharacterized protein LOC106427589 [Brassica napus]|uniref:uncharacterized protein LOC106427589 n=1 Tax=Brassica napus TaxID=3708 RepID=UPI002078E130|nr:uncharacterized protein LOC106427589 [Brassica napus]